MATKIKQIIDAAPPGAMLFGPWLAQQGIDSIAQSRYTRSGWLERVSKGVYSIAGRRPTLLATLASYHTQLGKPCEVGAYTALTLRGYAHYLPMGRPTAYLFTDHAHKLPRWMLEKEWDMAVRYSTTTFLGDGTTGIDTLEVEGFELPVASPERAVMECLYLPDAADGLLDIYYLMEGLTTLRPHLVQALLERCTSVKVRRLFLYMAEKARHPWFNALDTAAIPLGAGRRMISPTGRYIARYDMTVPKELAEYE